MNRPRDISIAPRWRRQPRWEFLRGPVWIAPLASVIFLAGLPSPAQEALRSSLAGQAAAEARRIRPESLPYTFKTGDFRLRVVPSLGLDYNDNINTAKTDSEDDFILRPQLQFNLSYPVSQYNLLYLDVGVGYDYYFNHNELSTWWLRSGSALSFDMYVGDFWFNLHDRFQYVRDSAREAAVANTDRYGTFDNTAGLSATWDLEDVTLSAGYDHENVISPDSQYQYLNRASEMFFGRAGLKVHPRLTTGLEGTTSLTRYDQTVLNNNTAYSAGLYADWRPGSYFRVLPRGGYSLYLFDQTSSSIQTSDLNSWYADVTVTHQPTEAVSYSLSVGHETRLGIRSDAIEDSYIRSNVNWKILKNVNLTTMLSYENGKQGVGNVAGNLTETYDWFGGGLGASYMFMKAASVSLNYRLTLRSSTTASREYTQNLVQLQLTYHP